MYELDTEKKILVFDDFRAVQVKDAIIPFLGSLEVLAQFPSVTVDMGAVRFVCNGAKVLRPGIVDFMQFKKGDIVVVRDQSHGKMLSVGIALEDSDNAKMMTKGYVIDNLHYISDKVWEAHKEI